MAHVQIKYSGDGASIVVDGMEIAPSVLADGFGVEFGDSDTREAKVHFVLAAETLEIDLPEALLRALANGAPR